MWQTAVITFIISEMRCHIFFYFIASTFSCPSPKNQSRPLEKSDGSGKFIRQRLFPYWKALICRVAENVKIVYNLCTNYCLNLCEYQLIVKRNVYICIFSLISLFFLISSSTSYGFLAAIPIGYCLTLPILCNQKFFWLQIEIFLPASRNVSNCE